MFVPRQCAAVSTKWRLMIEPEHDNVFPGRLAVTLTAHGASTVADVPFQTAPAGAAKIAQRPAATARRRIRDDKVRVLRPPTRRALRLETIPRTGSYDRNRLPWPRRYSNQTSAARIA
jgi:hypothetical protein